MDTVRALCTSPCLWLGDHLSYCRPVRVLNEASSDCLWTWAPDGAEWVMLAKVVGHTLVYVPRTDCVHFAQPAFALANGCAPNTVILCQCMRDTRPELGPPRLLAVDLLCDGGRSCSGMRPAERYARLRALEAHLAQGACALQWCGQRAALDASFIASLPHSVRALVAVGAEPGEVWEESHSS
jgi:hypothetical protein